jgi:uncharacterized protein Smg (DUF494 family)
MQERILEIIVYLLNELQQERKGIDKIDLTRDLLVKGYTEGEVNLAFSWIFNHLKSPSQDRIDSDIDYTEQFEDYPEFERLIISPDAYGFLLQLIQLGVIKENYGKDDISVEDLKSIVATILFGLDNRSSFNGYPFFQGDTTIQ